MVDTCSLLGSAIVLVPPLNYRVSVVTSGSCQNGFLTVGSSSVQLGVGAASYTESALISASLNINKIAYSVNSVPMSSTFNYPVLCATSTSCVLCMDFYNMIICAYPWIWYLTLLALVAVSIYVIRTIAVPVKYMAKLYGNCRSAKPINNVEVDAHRTTNTNMNLDGVSLKKMAAALAIVAGTADAWHSTTNTFGKTRDFERTDEGRRAHAKSLFAHTHGNHSDGRKSVHGESHNTHKHVERRRLEKSRRRLSIDDCLYTKPIYASTDPPGGVVANGNIVTFNSLEGCVTLQVSVPTEGIHYITVCFTDLLLRFDFEPIYDFAADWTNKAVPMTQYGTFADRLAYHGQDCTNDAQNAQPVWNTKQAVFPLSVTQGKVIDDIEPFGGQSCGADDNMDHGWCSDWSRYECSAGMVYADAETTITALGTAFENEGSYNQVEMYVFRQADPTLDEAEVIFCDLVYSGENVTINDHGYTYTLNVNKIILTDIEEAIDTQTLFHSADGIMAAKNKIYIGAIADSPLGVREEGCSKENFFYREVVLRYCADFFTYGMVYQGFRLYPWNKDIVVGTTYDDVSGTFLRGDVSVNCMKPSRVYNSSFWTPDLACSEPQTVDKYIWTMCNNWHNINSFGMIRCLSTMTMGSVCSGLYDSLERSKCFLGVTPLSEMMLPKNPSPYEPPGQFYISYGTYGPNIVSHCGATAEAQGILLSTDWFAAPTACTMYALLGIMQTLSPFVNMNYATVQTANMLGECLKNCYSGIAFLGSKGWRPRRTLITFEDIYPLTSQCGFAEEIFYKGYTESLCDMYPPIRWTHANPVTKPGNGDAVISPEIILKESTSGYPSRCGGTGCKKATDFKFMVWKPVAFGEFWSTTDINSVATTLLDDDGNPISVTFNDKNLPAVEVTLDLGTISYNIPYVSPPSCPRFIGCAGFVGSIQEGIILRVNISDPTARHFGGSMVIENLGWETTDYEPRPEVYFVDAYNSPPLSTFLMELTLFPNQRNVNIFFRSTLAIDSGCADVTPSILECQLVVPDYPPTYEPGEDESRQETGGGGFSLDLGLLAGILGGVFGFILLLLAAYCICKLTSRTGGGSGKNTSTVNIVKGEKEV